MIRSLFVICAAAMVFLGTTGCSVRAPDYNPVLGGFAKPALYAGESMPVTVALDADSQSDMRAKPKM
jgi:hypothetical protein